MKPRDGAGEAWHDVARPGMALHSEAGLGKARPAGHGEAWRGKAGPGKAGRRGEAAVGHLTSLYLGALSG